MSLNGLDSQPIQDAYQSAINEAGGWFLMKYCSRDAVELLAQGKSGVNGARNAIAAYEEASPLYGLLIYRRRKVLIKFIPEGTSRLLQARTAVHFQDVLERYSPYETLLEITNSEALNDTSLASAFPLHTASPAASSNRLHEISEDAEDGGSAPVERPLNSSASTGNVFGTQRYKMERRVEQIMQPDRVPPSIRVTGDTPPSPTSSSTKRPAISQFLIREDLGHTSIRSLDSPRSIASVTEYAASDTSSLHRLDSATAASATATATGTSAPTSSATAAAAAIAPAAATTAEDWQRSEVPATEEVKPARAIDTMPPPALPERSSIRPSADAEPVRAETPVERPSLSDSVNGLVRSSTSTSGRTKLDDDIYDFTKYEYKPKVKLGPRPVAGADMAKRPTTASVAGVPAQYRSAAAKKQEIVRPKSQGATAVLASAPVAQPTLPAPPPIPTAAEYTPRPVSRGSIKSLPTHKTNAMTPDKIRLMKAVELRKKQLRKSNPQDSFQPPKEEDLLSIPPVPEVPAKSPRRLTPPEFDALEDVDDQTNKADSGIELHYDKSIDTEPQQILNQTPFVTAAPPEPQTAPAEAPAVSEALPAEPELADPTTPTLASQGGEQGLLPLSAVDVEAPAEPVPVEELRADMEEREMESGDEFVDARSVSTPIPTLDADGASVVQAPHDASAEELPTDAVTVEDAPDTLDDDLDSITPTEELQPLSPKRQDSDLAKRRRGLVEPLQIDINQTGNPDDFMSDDDDFLEELRSAPVEQAKPIQVAKSPATVDFPRRRPSTASGVSDAGASVKSIRIKKSAAQVADRSPENITRLSPEPAQVPHYTPTGMVEKQDAAAGGRGLARNVSSGISKRIAALAEVSSRESISKDNAPSRPLTPETSPNAFLQRDQRERSTMVRNTHKARPISFRRQSSKSSAASASTMLNVADNAPVVSVQRDAAGNRNSVSVTARIVRPNAAREIGSSNSNTRFQQSELSISTASPSYQSPTSYTHHAESLHSVNSPGALSPPLSPTSAESRSTSRFGRKQSATSPSPEDFPPPPTQRPTTSTSHKTEESASTKEGSRTSRFLKRMSNFGAGGKRKSNPQRSSAASSVPSGESVPVRTVESKPSLAVPEKPDTPPAVVVGDLNVQFPDSLLWKRRIVTIDENGNLQFAIAQAMDIHKSVAVKKFHLADFKLPYAPDLDYQELPHSVVLEFSDGTSLQVACEDAMTQRQVLHLLKTHWKAWAQPS